MRQGIENAAAGLQSLRAFIRIADAHAVAAAVPQCRAQTLTQPGKIDDDVAQARPRERLQVIRNQRPAGDRQERLRHAVGERAHALTATGCQDEGLHARAAAAATFAFARASPRAAWRSRKSASP